MKSYRTKKRIIEEICLICEKYSDKRLNKEEALELIRAKIKNEIGMPKL